jgi:hypothetical protein
MLDGALLRCVLARRLESLTENPLLLVYTRSAADLYRDLCLGPNRSPALRLSSSVASRSGFSLPTSTI